MVTISISAEAYRAITGGPQAPSLRDDRGGYRFTIDHKTLDRLTAARGPRRELQRRDPALVRWPMRQHSSARRIGRRAHTPGEFAPAPGFRRT
jgi:hypothetical protein